MAARPEPRRPRLEALEALANVLVDARAALNDGPSADGCWVEIRIEHWAQIHGLLNELLTEPITTEVHDDGGSDDPTANEPGDTGPNGTPGIPDDPAAAIQPIRPRRPDREYRAPESSGTAGGPIDPGETLSLF